MSVSCPAREKEEVRGEQTVWDHVQVSSQSEASIVKSWPIRGQFVIELTNQRQLKNKLTNQKPELQHLTY